MTKRKEHRSPRVTASDRMQRLLALIPWVAAREGPTLAEVCQRFDVTQAQLLSDLDLLLYVGLWPYTPDALFDVVVEDGRVWIYLAPSFDRPLRLTAEQGLALVAAGASLLAVPGAGDATSPLARGLAKLSAALGIGTSDVVEVDLGEAEETTLGLLQDAIAANRQVEIDYYAFGRDERAVRVVDPYRVYNDQGQWYLIGWCHRARDERVFRIDRVVAARPLESAFSPPDAPPVLGMYEPTPDDPRVILDLEPEAGWVREQYPCESIEDLGGGRTRVTLAVSARPWVERLLLVLGPSGRLVSATAANFDDAAGVAARRVLARYGKA